jgi:hypothetical protein
MTMNYTKRPQTIQNSLKIDKVNIKYTIISIARSSQIGIFGLQIYHLATLVSTKYETLIVEKEALPNFALAAWRNGLRRS